MKYRIEWSPTTLRRFTAKWEVLDSGDQRIVMDALDGIDYLLMNSPMLVGESRAKDTDRILFKAPVVVEYRVEMRLGLVSIASADIFWKQD